MNLDLFFNKSLKLNIQDYGAQGAFVIKALCMRNDICLLLTAAIEVKNKDLVVRNNTAVRLEDYKGVLKQWLTKTRVGHKIVFVENSGYPLDELKEIVAKNNPYRKEVEFLQYVASGQDLKDKSYAEINQVKYALDHSKLLSDCQYFMEISGRAYIQNIDEIIENAPKHFHAIGEFANNLAYLETNIIIFEREFFEKEIYEYAKKNIRTEDNSYLERGYAKAILVAIANDYKWYPFAVEPIVVGIGGTKNKLYGRGRWFSIRGTLITKMYCRFYRTAYSKNQKHLLESWNIKPRGAHLHHE